MKKVLAVFLSLLMVLGIVSCALVSVNAADEPKKYSGCLVTVDGVQYCVGTNENLGEGIVVVSYESSGIKKVEIPSRITASCEITGCKHCGGSGASYDGRVIAIEKNAFKGKSDVVEIIVPETVFYIGTSAFYGCSNLTSIELAEKVDEDIFENAEGEQSSPEEVLFKLREIPQSAFSGCISLTEITIPENVGIIYDSAFNGCTSLAKVWVEGELTYIGKNAFNGCKSLITITGPRHPYSIGVSFPNTVTGIGPSAFAGCKSVYAVYVPKGIEKIQKSCFANCTSLNVLDIPNNVKTIEESAFSGCSSLPEVCVPDSVEDIQKNAFSNCSSLQKAEFPETLTKLSNSVLSGCKNLKEFEIPEYAMVIEANALKGCASITKFTVPTGKNGVYIIGNSAFYGCEGLTSINIPTELTTINPSVFANCKSLAKIEIPNNITNIGASAFQNCDALKSVKIPDSVINIRESAFTGCDSLESVTISKSCETIGVNAFSNCKVLKKVKIPNSVKVLGSGAFLGCKGLTEVVVDADLSAIATNTFSGTPEECVFKCKCGTYAFEFAKEMGYNTQCIDHSSVKWVKTKKATVYKKGLEEKKCIDCGLVVESKVVPQLKCKAPEMNKAKNTSSGIKISWDRVKGADKYRIYRKTKNGDWTYIGSVSGKNDSYTDSTAKSGTKYWYAVKARNEAGNSVLSDSVSRYFLSAPKLKSAKATSKGVKLEWSKVKGAESYFVYRKANVGGEYEKIKIEKGTSNLSYTDKTAKKGVKYTYRIKANFSKTNSAYSNGKTITK
ncbi:MAG: leucine-rich repeat protein [Acutalibacteraceae bacterium]|nr:leucine-rich repeat protein [Acutalibacteraceae bacterium]